MNLIVPVSLWHYLHFEDYRIEVGLLLIISYNMHKGCQYRRVECMSFVRVLSLVGLEWLAGASIRSP